MKIDGARSRQPTHPRKRKAPESSQGSHVDGLGEPARGSGSTSCHPARQSKKAKLKPPTSLNDLPAELQARICSNLKGGPFQTVRDMTAFRSTSRVQSESLLQEGYLWPLDQELRPLVRAVGQCFREEEARLSSLRHLLEVQGTLTDDALLEGLHQHAILSRKKRILSPEDRKAVVESANQNLLKRLADHATAFAPATTFLSPRQRGTLARLVSSVGPGIADKRILSTAIASLCRELAHLEVPQRTDLVDAALRLSDRFKPDAITGLVASLEHLGSSQRDRLVAEITLRIDPGNEYWARPLQALGPKLALLEEDQCKGLVQAAAHLPLMDHAKAIVGLFKGLAHLDPARREMIINPAVEALDHAGGFVLPGLGSIALLRGLEYFSESQREKIIASARTTLHLCPDSYLGTVIAEVAPAAEHISKAYIDAMFRRAISPQQGKAHALRGLGMCIAHLDEAQREALLRAACSMQDDQDRSWAIGGMAGGVVHLGEDGRNTLIAEVKRMKDDYARGSAIRDFGESEGLQHLSPAHRQDLIAAATTVVSIIGLAKSLRHLAQPEREALLEAAERLNHPRDRARATVALAKATSEALLFPEQDMREQ